MYCACGKKYKKEYRESTNDSPELRRRVLQTKSNSVRLPLVRMRVSSLDFSELDFASQLTSDIRMATNSKLQKHFKEDVGKVL
jgi:hypothetical protein